MLLWSLLVIFAPISEEAGKPDWLTLQAPSVVFEGDSIDLMCLKRKDWWEIQTMAYYKDGNQLELSGTVFSFPIPRAAVKDSGYYHCTVTARKFLINKSGSSERVRIEVQELFRRPVLAVSPLWPTEGSPVTLTCETRPSPRRPHTWLQFCFFREGRALGSGWSRSPELRVPAMWTEDSGSYCCQVEAVTPGVTKQSLPSQIHVQRVPVSNISLEVWAPKGPVIEGGTLVLLCSVAKGTGNITFSWHREDTGTRVGRKSQRALSAALEVPVVQESHAGHYYCRADNGREPIQSPLLSIRVTSPVSRPVLTLREPGAQAMVGDVVELRCEAQRGSPPILYWFYHENVTLGNMSDPSGGGASFNLSLTAEHSGNYSCEADNGLGAQRSEAVPLNVAGASGHRADRVTARVLGVLCGGLAFLLAALLGYYWCRQEAGGHSAPHAPRDASSANPQEPTHADSLPDSEELQPDYVNVGPVDDDTVYSQVWSIQPPEDSANTRRTILQNKDSHVIYSEVRGM